MALVIPTEPGDEQTVAPSQAELVERLERAKGSGVPNLYANGYVNLIGTGDVVMVLERNGDPVAILNVSYTVAKSLSRSLGLFIAQIEERSEREIMTTNDVARLMRNEGTDG